MSENEKDAKSGTVPLGVWRDLGYDGPLSDAQITEALYALGGYSPEGCAIEMTIAALRAEVERLTKERDFVLRQTCSHVWEERRQVEARVASLEKAIRDAPHGGLCDCDEDGTPRYGECNGCDCWKRAALAGEAKEGR